MMPVAILCGGLGTRLGELTADMPKSLVSVCGRYFIEWQLDLLKQSGYRNLVLCVGHKGHRIANYVGSWLHYSWDDPLDMGTGGAIKNALPLLGDEFMVLYGDSYLECSYELIEREFRRKVKSALITLYNHMPYGLGVFKASAFDGFEGKFDLNEVYSAAALRNDLAAMEMSERWYEIGSPRGLEETCRHIASVTSKESAR